MRFLKNDHGYTMLFTFGLIILFTILGVSLLTITSNGVSRNEVRQSTSQSNDLAEKGITYFTEKLNSELTTQMSSISTSSDVKRIFNDFGNRYGCKGLYSDDNTPEEINLINADKTVKIESETGEFNVCISKIENSSNEYSRLVTFKSIGNADDTKKTHSAQSEIGYKFIPGVLNYAISTNKGGNLYLFGGSEVVGDIKVAGEMYVRDKAFWSNTNQPRWVDSILPRVISASTSPNIYVNNQEIYKFKSDVKPSDFITKTNPTILKDGLQTINQENIHEGLFLKPGETAPTLQPGKPDNLALNIKEKVEDVGSASGGIYDGTNISDDYKSKNFNGVNNQDGAHTKGYKVDEGSALYIGGNMRIGRFSANGNGSDNPKDYKDFNLDGNYFVNGNVVISGAKLKGNAVLYVKGSVDIEFSTINENNPTNTLFIFAEGPIEIHNISVNSNPGKGSVINGFFYSNSNFLMYGVGSNTKITGGVSAVNATFTALRGHSVDRVNENSSSATDLTSTNPNPIINACEKNDENSDDREGNYEYMLEMANKPLLNEFLNQLMNAGEWKRTHGGGHKWEEYNRIPVNNDDDDLTTRELSRLINLLDNPTGNKERTITVTRDDIINNLYTQRRDGDWERLDGDDLGKKRVVKNFHIRDSAMKEILSDTNSLLSNWGVFWVDFNNVDFIFNNYSYKYDGQSPKKITFTSEEIANIQKTFTLLYNVLNELYGDGSSTSRDECAEWRENINTGGNNSTLPTYTIGGVNYSSRLTIIYDEELITRYLNTNEIQLNNSEISVLPGTVKSLSIE